MEIKLQTIEIQNFLSVTNCINFEFKNGIDIVTAMNGSGKSSIFLDAICFALYGTPYRNITLKQMINRSTKSNLLVRLKFQVDDNFYAVARGQTPQIFDLFKNGEIISNLPSIKDNQKFLEETILKTNLKLFKSIVLLNSEFFKGWLSMCSKDRMEIMEHITDYTFFKKVKEISTSRIKCVNESLGRKQFLIDTWTKQIEDLSQKQQEIDENFEKHLHIKMSELKKLTHQRDEIQSNYGELQNLIDERLKLEKNLTRMKQLIEVNANHIKNSIKIICPNCKNEFFSEDVDDMKKILKDDIEKYKNELEKRKSLVEKISTLENVSNSYHLLLNEINQIKAQILALEKQRMDVSNFDNSINELQKQIDDTRIYELKLSKTFDILKNLLKLLKGNTIQNYLKQQLHFFNQICNSIYSQFYSKKDILIEIDSAFNVIINQCGVEVNSNSLSSGEKARVSFSILFAFIKFLEMKNSICWNVLVMDEVLDGFLDYSGREALFQILQSITNKDLIIITHNSDVDNIGVEFSRKISIVNDKGSKFL